MRSFIKTLLVLLLINLAIAEFAFADTRVNTYLNGVNSVVKTEMQKTIKYCQTWKMYTDDCADEMLLRLTSARSMAEDLLIRAANMDLLSFQEVLDIRMNKNLDLIFGRFEREAKRIKNRPRQKLGD